MSTPYDTDSIYIGCECHSPEHIIRVSYFDWAAEEKPEMFFALQASNSLTFWQRLILAAKFVVKGERLEWHDVIADHNDLIKLKNTLDKYHSDYKLWQKANTDGK